MQEIKPESVEHWMCTECDWIGDYKETVPAMFRSVNWQKCPSCLSVAIPDPRKRLPGLRNGDPVVVKAGNGVWLNRHYWKEGIYDKSIIVYSMARSKWTNICDEGSAHYEWRLPTKQELSEAGYTESQISDLEKRRCVG